MTAPIDIKMEAGVAKKAHALLYEPKKPTNFALQDDQRVLGRKLVEANRRLRFAESFHEELLGFGGVKRGALKQPCSLVSLRSRIQNAATLGRNDASELRDRVLCAPWIDCRTVPTFSDSHCADFGKEMFEQGLLVSPFDEFALVTATPKDGGEAGVTTVDLIAHNGSSFKLIGYITVLPNGSALAQATSVNEVPDAVFELLAFIESSEATVSSSLRTPAKEDGSNIGNAYWIVSLAAHRYISPASSEGRHAPPRLHWRRGHVRRLPCGRVTKVRPTLVGSSDRGVIVKDYSARRSEGAE